MGNFKVRDKMNPTSIRPPTNPKPRAKWAKSPIIPIPVGMVPPPMRKARGIVKETARFRALEDPIQERAAKPAGKKQTANIGCKNTMITSQEPFASPRSKVVVPVRRNTAAMILFAPKRSVAQPAIIAIIGPEMRDMATNMLAEY